MFKKIFLTVLLVLAATPCFGYGESSVQAGPRPFYAQDTDPATSDSIGWGYTKKVLGITELHFKDDAGNVVQLTNDGALKQYWVDNGTYLDPFASRVVRNGSVELWTTGIFSPIYAGSAGISSSYASRVTDGANAIGHVFNTNNSLASSGTKLASFQNQSSEQAYISRLGSYVGAGFITRAINTATALNPKYNSYTATLITSLWNGTAAQSVASYLQSSGANSGSSDLFNNLFFYDGTGASHFGIRPASSTNKMGILFGGEQDSVGTSKTALVMGAKYDLVNPDSKIISFRDNIGINAATGDEKSYFKADGTLGNNGGYFSETALEPASLGTSILTDGSIENWTDPNTPTSWDAIPADGGGGGSANQESTIVYAGSYAVRFNNDAGGAGYAIGQLNSGLTAGDDYRLTYYARDDGSGFSSQALFFNGQLGVATQIYNFTTTSWVNGTGPGGTVDPSADIGPDNLAEETLTNAYAAYTADVPVPANGTLYPVITADGMSAVVYVDLISLQKIVSAVPKTIHDFYSDNDASEYGAYDYVFKFRTTGGTPANQFALTGDGIIEAAFDVLKFDLDTQTLGRTLGTQGTDIASANDITLTSGNYFDITGTTQINRIATAGWTAGSRVILQFDDVVTVKDAQAAGSGYASILVSSSSDYVSAAGSMAEIVFDGTSWRLYPIFVE